MFLHIGLERLVPHPNNPRKDLGDLTELAESIRAKGRILQNLTVIPADMKQWDNFTEDDKKNYPGNYTVVVGHRRREAALLAGLKEAPCMVLDDLDDRAQIAMMLLENIQRNDLTLAEQGQGFQMMLDLGDDYKSISAQTGISETTIRKKVKIVNTFGAHAIEAVTKVQERPIALEDYEKVAKIEDKDERNDVFDTLGTEEFDWALKSALNNQKKNEFKKRMAEEAQKFAEEGSRQDYVSSKIKEYWSFYNCNEDDVIALREFAKNVDIKDDDNQYFFFLGEGFTGLTVYLKDDISNEALNEIQGNAEEEDRIKEAERQENINKLMARFVQARDMRAAFIRKFTGSSKHSEAINTMIVQALLGDSQVCETTLRTVFGIKTKFRPKWQEGSGETLGEAVSRIIHQYQGQKDIDLRLIGAYCRMESESHTLHAINRDGTYKPNTGLMRLYENLTALGYRPSKEESQLIDGSHSLFAQEEDED